MKVILQSLEELDVVSVVEILSGHGAADAPGDPPAAAYQ